MKNKEKIRKPKFPDFGARYRTRTCDLLHVKHEVNVE